MDDLLLGLLGPGAGSSEYVENVRARVGQPLVATAMLDQFVHHSHILTIRGDSYRLRAKRKSGLIKPPPDGDGPPVGSASLRSGTVGNNLQPRS